MIRQIGKSFVLDTEHTTYGFRVLETGHLEHLYYGRKIRLDEASLEAIGEKRIFPPGNTCLYRADHPELSLEGICLEMSAHGKGDIREPFLEVVHFVLFSIRAGKGTKFLFSGCDLCLFI